MGFESSAMYGEESRNPQRNVPIAVMASVLGIGIFDVLVSWMAVVGSGEVGSIALTQPCLVIVVFFAVTGRDPYGQLYGLMAILGTTAILIVQALTAFSVISFFHIRGEFPQTRNMFRTLLAPLLGGLGMVYVIYLLVANASFAAGTGATDPVFSLIPWIVGFLGIDGAVLALVLRARHPQRYARIGAVDLTD